MQRSGVLSVAALFVISLLAGLLAAAPPISSNLNEEIGHFGVSNNATDHWVTPAGGTGADMVWDMVLDSQGNSYHTGSFSGTATFGSTTLTANGGMGMFVAKMDHDGNWLWASQTQGQYDEWGTGITLSPTGEVYVTGVFMDSQGSNSPSVTIGSTSLSAHLSSNYDLILAKLDGNSGSWTWAMTSDKYADMWVGVDEYGAAMPMDLIYHDNKVFVVGSFVGTLSVDSMDSNFYSSNGSSTDIFVGAATPQGTWEFQAGLGSSESAECAYAIAPTINGGFVFGGIFQGSSSYWSYPLSSASNSQDVFIGHVDSALEVTWMTSAGGSQVDELRDLVTDSSGNIYAVGEFNGVLAQFGNDRLTANSGGTDIWLGKLDSVGSWQWAKKAGGASDDMGFSVALSPDQSTVYTTGQLAGQSTFENSQTTLMANSSGASDAFVSLSDALTGDWRELYLAGGPSGGDRGWAIDVDSANVVHTAGRFKGTASSPGEFGSDELTSAGDFDIFVWKGLIEDDDNDKIANEDDDCPDTWGSASVEPYVGCVDTDGDGYADVDDSHPVGPTQWRDQDGDTYGDNPSGNLADDCPTVNGTSTIDRLGCTDSDSDGWSDQRDAFPTEPTQWNNSDGDAFGDNWDDEELTSVYASLGLGQYVYGAVDMDYCPTLPGVWTIDNPGCPDTDGDGYSDVTDDFPNNPTQWQDTDGDGWGDNSSSGSTQHDELPFDETQYRDRDGDGWGDDPDGNSADQFPDDWTQQVDMDEDEYGDNSSGNNGDACPDEYGTSWRDRLGCPDLDGDGTSDDGDAFPDDWSQWHDTDGDGQGDNWANPHWNDSRYDHWPGEFIPGAQNADKHPLDRDGDGFEDEGVGLAVPPFDDCPDEPGRSWGDRNGCPDLDDDGWSDANDLFPNEPTQWRDSDRDGFGDERAGINGDDCTTIRGDSEHDRLGCPDTDGDGWSDPMEPPAQYVWNISEGADMFPADPLRWNQSHVISESKGGLDGSGGLAAGLGLGALIALMFAMVFAIFVMKMRSSSEDDDEYEDYEDETEADQGRTSRAADIARSWQEHGTAPPPAPDGAELLTSASAGTGTQGGTTANVVYATPPSPTPENTLSSPSGMIPPAPMPPSDPLPTTEEQRAIDTALAMSLLVGTSEEDEAEEAEDVEVGEVDESEVQSVAKEDEVVHADDEAAEESTAADGWGVDDDGWGEEE